MGKRYYYDSKGRYKGKSSDTFIADGSTYKMLAIIAVIAIIGRMIFGSGDKETSPEVDKEVSTNQSVQMQAPDVSPEASQIIAATPIAIEETQAENLAANESVEDQTGESLPPEVIGNDPKCPQDIIEYYKSECEAGDAQACSLAACEN